jgi:hypothetical protein
MSAVSDLDSHTPLGGGYLHAGGSVTSTTRAVDAKAGAASSARAMPAAAVSDASLTHPGYARQGVRSTGAGPSSARLRSQRSISHPFERSKRASTRLPRKTPRTRAVAGPP